MLQVAIAFIVEAFVLKIQAAIKRRVCMKHPNSNCGCPRQEGIIVAFLAVMNMQGHRKYVLDNIQMCLCHPSGIRVFSELRR